ncbi:MAG: helix-turn-helix domain-containing protein [Ruminococcus sp.]|nr:helix-turn-helix domain-containing protein [Ruminococcus sp.]
MQSIGSRLRKARWSKGITIREISESSGLNKNSIIGLELKGVNSRVDTLWKICKYTGISADYLLGFSENMFSNNCK